MVRSCFMFNEQPPRFERPPGSGEQTGNPTIQPDHPTDLWGNPATLPRAPRSNRRNGIVRIGGLALQQERLFTPEEMQVPFPAEPVNKTPDVADEADEPGTLFYIPAPEPESTQATLFAAPPGPSFDTQTLPPASDVQEPRERLQLPVDPDVGELPDDLKPFVTYVPFHLLSEQQRKQGVIAHVTTRFFVYSSPNRGYVPGIVFEASEGHARQIHDYGVTQNPSDIHAAYDKIRKAIKVQGLQPEAADTPQSNAPQPSERPVEEPTPAAEETERNPLLGILREDEIYVDPNEVTVEEAEENGYPLLRRDVVTYRWWLEFSFDTRDQPQLYEALKAAGWRWGGYRQQWFNPAHFPQLPKAMPYANAGPAWYSDENAERIEARATRARTQSSEHYERSNKLAEIIPFGQPMLRDHYSYRSDLAYRKKIWRQMDLFVAFYKKAEWLEERAEGSRRLQRRKSNVHAMQDRQDRLQADLRAMRRGYEEAKAKQATGEYDYYRRRLTILASEILPLQEGIAARGGLPIDRIEAERPLQPGDYVQIRGRGVYVLKVNEKTIKVADHSVTYANGQPWESTYKKSELQRVLATREELAARQQQKAKTE